MQGAREIFWGGTPYLVLGGGYINGPKLIKLIKLKENVCVLL
jgi:hypothetical protein